MPNVPNRAQGHRDRNAKIFMVLAIFCLFPRIMGFTRAFYRSPTNSCIQITQFDCLVKIKPNMLDMDTIPLSWYRVSDTGICYI